MRILVTGGCGLIGTNLIRFLNDHTDHVIRVFDNESMGKREHLVGLAAEFVRGDLRSTDEVSAALDGMDAVVHLAADTRVMDSIADPKHNFHTNVIGTFNLLEAMRTRGLKRILNASTGGAILGEVEPPVHEEMVPRPLAPYGAAKLAVEGYCHAYSSAYGFSAMSLRFSNVFGPRSFHKGSVVAAFFKRILKGEELVVFGDGAQIRDFIYVDDLCEGIHAALSSGLSGVFQLGSGIPVSVSDLISVMRKVVHPMPVTLRHEPFRAGEILATYCDISKAKGLLGFSPRTELREGLERTWKWFLEQPH